MKLITKLNRFLNFPKYPRSLFSKIKLKKKKENTLEFLNKMSYKSILIMNCSPFMKNMFKQRPHHFLDFFSEHFDIVLYRSYIIDEVEHLRNNIYLVPYLPKEKLENKDVYYYICSVTDFSYKSLIKMKKLGYKIIYDYYDEISDDIICSKAARLIHKNITRINPEIIIASSDRLYKDIKKLCPKREVLLIKNGVCIEDFIIEKNENEIPNDLLPIIAQKKPIVGYYGYIANWMDITLINILALAYPDYNFVYIGKILQHTNFDVAEYKNIHFLGYKSYNDLVKYAIWFDCCTIPFKKGNLAKAVSPVKLFEYMAMKKPVVCTRDLLECKGYDGVLMSETYEEFVKNIDIAIKLSKDENIQNKLFAYAKENSWKPRAEEIIKKIEEIR